MVLLVEAVAADIFLQEVHRNRECPAVREVVVHHLQEWEGRRAAAAEEAEAAVSVLEEEVILAEETVVGVAATSVDEEEWIGAAEGDPGEDPVEEVQVAGVVSEIAEAEVADAVAVVHRKEEVDHRVRADPRKGRDSISRLRNPRTVMRLNHRVKVDTAEVPAMLIAGDSSNRSSNRQ